MTSPIRPPFEMATLAASQAIHNPTTSTRKPQDTALGINRFT